LYYCIALNVVLSLSAFVLHPLICMHYADKIAALTNNSVNREFGSASSSASGGKSNQSKKIEAMERIVHFSRNIKIVAFLNFLVVLMYGMYTFNHKINFATGVDAFGKWRMFFILTEVLLPLVQFTMLIIVLKVFQSASDVAESREFKGIAIGIILIIGTLIVLVITDGEVDVEEVGGEN